MTDQELEEMHQFEVEHNYSDHKQRLKFWKEFDEMSLHEKLHNTNLIGRKIKKEQNND
jgi:hypothetical protein